MHQPAPRTRLLAMPPTKIPPLPKRIRIRSRPCPRASGTLRRSLFHGTGSAAQASGVNAGEKSESNGRADGNWSVKREEVDKVVPQEVDEVSPQKGRDVVAPQKDGDVVAPQQEDNEVVPQEEVDVVAPQEAGDLVAPQQESDVVAPQEQDDVVAPQEQSDVVAPLPEIKWHVTREAERELTRHFKKPRIAEDPEYLDTVMMLSTDSFRAHTLQMRAASWQYHLRRPRG